MLSSIYDRFILGTHINKEEKHLPRVGQCGLGGLFLLGVGCYMKLNQVKSMVSYRHVMAALLPSVTLTLMCIADRTNLRVTTSKGYFACKGQTIPTISFFVRPFLLGAAGAAAVWGYSQWVRLLQTQPLSLRTLGVGVGPVVGLNLFARPHLQT